MDLPFAEPFKTKMVEEIFKSTKDQREEWIKKASYNLFSLKSEQVFIDLLTDSGTGAMSDRQWAGMMAGDESYAGASSYYNLRDAVKEITGFEFFLPGHQGRAAENVLFSVLVKEGDIIPGNSHFDTTKGHIEFRKAKAVDCLANPCSQNDPENPFRGNADVVNLERILKENAGKVPCIIMTVTNNTAGGEPVSMANLREVSSLARKYGVRLIIDSARFAENAYFIKKREDGYAHKDIRDIAREMFSYADAMTMSAKKDAIVNMGGFTGFRDENLFEEASIYNIMFEGFVTYGGMSGRDMNALARGLYEGTEFPYLESRIKQVEYLGKKLKEAGVPVLEPFGGHAIFIDANKFLPSIPREEFPAQTLAVELYIEGGIRSVEIGALMADRDPVTRENRYPETEFVRLAIPRRVYSDNHLNYVAAAVINVFQKRESVKRGVRIIKESPILRHFTIGIERL
jgi:tryptophanase